MAAADRERFSQHALGRVSTVAEDISDLQRIYEMHGFIYTPEMISAYELVESEMLALIPQLAIVQQLLRWGPETLDVNLGYLSPLVGIDDARWPALLEVVRNSAPDPKRISVKKVLSRIAGNTAEQRATAEKFITSALGAKIKATDEDFHSLVLMRFAVNEDNKVYATIATRSDAYRLH